MKKGFKVIHYICSLFLLLSGIIVCLTGCGDKGPSVSISASPETILSGESTVLTWLTHDADSVSINNGVGTVDKRGTKEVKPLRTTTYTISAVNANGKSKSSVTVTIEYTGPKPIINVSADPTTIKPGESSVISWSSTNAYTVTMNDGTGAESVPLNYSKTVSPKLTTTYTFIAFGQGGETKASVRINVIMDPPTAEIAAYPTQIKPGEESLLEWSYTNADTVTIEPDIGDGTQFNSIKVFPVTTTKYTITASGSGGTATDHVTIYVITDPNEIFVNIEANPMRIYAGETTELSWTTFNASRVWIEPGIGDVELTGIRPVSPIKTTTYIIHAEKDGLESKSNRVTVTVKYKEPVINLSANPTTIRNGETSVLTWNVINAYTLTISDGITTESVPLIYSRIVSPSVTTMYTFEASNPDGKTQETIKITVINDEPPTAQISATPTHINLGEDSLLEWSYTNAETVTIMPGIGDGTQINSSIVTPETTTTYTIEAIGPGGIAKDEVTIIVTHDPTEIFAHIEANPMRIYEGESTELSWTTRNAIHAWIKPDIGDVELTGKRTVTPETTTTYEIHATKDGHEEAISRVTVNVKSPIPIINVSANPITIYQGKSSVITWSTINAQSVEIDQGIGLVALSGSLTVTPPVSTTYRIKATGPGGETSKDVTIYVTFVPLGNQQFSPENALEMDPLAPYRLESDLSTSTNSLLQEKIDWSNKIPPVQDQLTTGSDNAWAMVYYLRSFQESVVKQKPVIDTMFSPMFTYALQCRDDNAPWNLIKTWKITHRYGCTLWTSLPFEDLNGFMDNEEIAAYGNYKISDILTTEAMQYRLGTPVILADLDQIRMMLTQTPVVLAINHFDPTLPELSTSEDQNYLRYLDQSDVGHTVLCMGYDNKIFETGALRIINSWGKEWAQQGMSWIKYPDVNKIVVSALTFHALSNKHDVNVSASEIPKNPKDVQATIDSGPYVDIQWTHVPSTRYYQIYRAPANTSLQTFYDVFDYECIGTTTHSPYRDYPAAGESYLYAVVAVNEFGLSKHFNHQNEKEQHIAKGSASGKSLKTPSISVETPPNESSSAFSISGMDPDTRQLQVFVSQNEYGPWQSFGWIKPQAHFVINWQKDSSWTGYQPYVRVVAENPSTGFSLASRATKVSSAIAPHNQVATINHLNAQSTEVKTIQLQWSLTGKNVEFLEIWRTHDIHSSSPTWIKLDTVASTLDSYHDINVLPGINYQYAVHCVFEGVSGNGKTSNIAQLPLNKPNLKITHVEYDTGPLMDPFEMELTVENNGNSTIQKYSFMIMAYNWATNETAVCLEACINNYPELNYPMKPGSQHIIPITFDLPEQVSSGQIFSWYILIDSTHVIEEAYESDNFYWAQKMCWMEMEQ